MWWNNYIRIPFQEKGRDAAGCDCWGLVKLIYKNELNIELPGYEEIYETTNDHLILSKTIKNERNAHWINPENPKEFDVIIVNMRGVPMHVGIVTKHQHMIHCAKDVGTAHERTDSMRWRNRIIGYARYERH